MRDEEILRDLSRTGRIEVAEAAAKFGVSEVTVRKDLARLEQQHALRRVRGGAIASATSDEGTFDSRLTLAAGRKKAVAACAAGMVGDGDAIVVDSSTTAFFMARHLQSRQDLVVITNGLRIAGELAGAPGVTVVMPGGVLRGPSCSIVGTAGEILTDRGRISKGFFGLRGLSTALGLLDLSFEEADTKALLAAQCDEVYGIFDSGKSDVFALYAFATPDQVSGLITDDGLSADIARRWEPKVRLQLVAT